MGRNKLKGSKSNSYRAWLILSVLVGSISVITASATAWLVNHPFATNHSDPLSVAEREGTFREIKAALAWPNLNFGIEGNALLIEGTAKSDAQIQEVIALVKKSLKADSFYVVHPYIQRPDWISGRVEAMREGKYDYQRPQRSVLIVDLMKAEEIPPARSRVSSLEDAERILSGIPTEKEIESLRVELIPRPSDRK